MCQAAPNVIFSMLISAAFSPMNFHGEYFDASGRQLFKSKVCVTTQDRMLVLVPELHFQFGKGEAAAAGPQSEIDVCHGARLCLWHICTWRCWKCKTGRENRITCFLSHLVQQGMKPEILPLSSPGPTHPQTGIPLRYNAPGHGGSIQPCCLIATVLARVFL